MHFKRDSLSGAGAVQTKISQSFDLNKYNELRANIVSEHAKRVIFSRSWKLTAVARKFNALIKKFKRTLTWLVSRATDPTHTKEYEQALAEAVELISSSGIFDEHFYLDQLEKRGLTTGDCVTHFLTKGWKEALNPNPFFDCSFYILEACSRNVQVTINPLLHFLLKGSELGLSTSPYFDTAYYVSNEPDVFQSGVNPLTHFLQYGIFENRLPIRLEESSKHAETFTEPMPVEASHFMRTAAY